MSYLAVSLLFFSAFGVFATPADLNSDGEKPSNALVNIPLPEKQILERARAANGDLYSALKSFVCSEAIQRYKGDLKGSKKRSIDHVSTNLSFENGVERYTDIYQDKNSRPSMSAIAGAWSEGEFGTLLQQTGKLLEVQPVSFVAFESLDGIPAAIYHFEVSEPQSPWDLAVGTAHYKIPFATDVWISVASGEILRIARKSISIPAETRISEIDWNVTLSAVDLNGTTWLLPSIAAYAVSYEESKRREWNQMSFSNYHRYGAESSLKFDSLR